MNIEHLNLLRELSRDNTLSQRELAKGLGLSLGKVNYVVNSLVEKGLIKAERFKNSRNKLAYMYIITSKGMAEKMKLTYKFLKRKTEEYDALKREIEKLKEDASRFSERTDEVG